LKEAVKALNAFLKGKKWIGGQKFTVADAVCGVTLAPAFQLCFDASFRKGLSNLDAWF
jgi:glutathione S-transferase